MHRSLQEITAQTPSHFVPGEPVEVAGNHRTYVVRFEEGEMRHHEQMVDLSGELIFDQAVPMRFVVGSGRRAQAYLHQRDALLFMSPLNWYSEPQEWDLAPGYVPDDPRRFDRRVEDDCLSCHAGQVAAQGRALNRYEHQPFREASIGCENCHGPGAAHVAYRTSPQNEAIQDPIVNPAGLGPDERESVCYQCHLLGAVRVPRYGRSHFDFRPGMRIEEIWTTLVNDADQTADGPSRSVSQVQQMRSSRCFRASQGQFGCISCHDPHRIPLESERVEFYRSKCNACHREAGCVFPQKERDEEGDSCIACHMPSRGTSNISHVAQTDHRVLRSDESSSTDPESRSADGLSFFDDAHLRLPTWEADRALGLGAYHYLSQSGRPLPDPLIQRLDEVLATVPQDGAVLTTLGAISLDRERLDVARGYLDRARSIPQAREAAMGGLLKIHYLSSNWQEALECADWLVDLDPGNYRAQAMRADILIHLGRLREGIAAAETAVRFNPTLVEVRQLLARSCRRAGQFQESQEQEELLNRMREVIER